MPQAHVALEALLEHPAIRRLGIPVEGIAERWPARDGGARRGPRGSLLRPRAGETQQERSAHPPAPSGRHWSGVYGAAAHGLEPLAAPPAPDRRVRPRG